MYFGRTEGPGNCQREDGQNGKKITSKLMEICPIRPVGSPHKWQTGCALWVLHSAEFE